MTGLIKGKKMLVMGVANKWSIGWGIADRFIDEGAEVIFSYFDERNRKSIEKLLSGKGLNPEDFGIYKCDVAEKEDFENLFKIIAKDHGKLKGVVHSIAYSNKDELRGKYYDTSKDGYLLAQEISSFSFVETAKYAKEVLEENGTLMALSYYGGEKVIKNYNVMGVAKAALEASVKYLANDFGEVGIRVNAISAGPIKTMSAKGVGQFDLIAKGFIERAPLKRMVTLEDLGNSALYLMSDLSSGVTGEILHVDCGFNITG
jgi:enoyl-[acyl-carrier protein] reductase I